MTDTCPLMLLICSADTLRRVGHFASGRSIKQQTNNKQQTTSKADPLPNSVLKVVSPLPMPFDRTVTWRQFAA